MRFERPNRLIATRIASWQNRVVFPIVAVVEAVHAELIDLYGGSHGLRDRGLLESAVARAENKSNYDPDASVPEVAAAPISC